MGRFVIKKGYEIPIQGDAQETVENLPIPPIAGLTPVEFRDLKVRLDVVEGNQVKVGTLLCHSKENANVKFLAPASGKIKEIRYGRRRVIEGIFIETDGKQEAESFKKFAMNEIAATKREQLVETLCNGGVWPYIRQRPFNKFAKTDGQPKAIFVNCMETAPIANNPNFSLKGKEREFEAGIEAMKVLAPQVHVVTHVNASPVFKAGKGVETHEFEGKHPAGLVGTHIGKINPINKGECVWYVNARDLVLIGSLLLEGRYPSERIVAVTGEGANKKQYFKTIVGSHLESLLRGQLKGESNRIISGNVLTGTKRGLDAFLGFYDDLVTIIPEGGSQDFLGWLTPGLSRPSFFRTSLSGWLPGKKYNMDTALNGGHRAIVQSGIYEQVVALDLHPEFLLKASLVGDLDAMEQLGILECDEEDFALVSYICPSKTDAGKIIREGLALMEKEG